MPSITTWTRLEPKPGPADLTEGYAAAVHDPLWFLARQWQAGEFKGSDGGTPVMARWRGQAASMTRYVAGAIAPNTQLSAGLLDSTVPLQVHVERQALAQSAGDAALDGLRLAIDTGLHFIRLLRPQPTSVDYAQAFRTTFALQPLSVAQRTALDPETAAFADLMAGRALDGRRLRASFGEGAEAHVDPALQVAPADHAEIQAAARAWRDWMDALWSTPADQAWNVARMEYCFNLSTRLADDQFGERTLTAASYEGGHLDWYTFDLNGDVNLGTAQDQPGEIFTRTVVPAPVTFPGMPSPRFWEFEDAKLNPGALTPGATDLAQLLLIETLTGYGNDWFVIPVELPVGSLATTRSLVVADSFGVRILLRPAGDPAARSLNGWSMFSLSLRAEPSDAFGVPVSNLFYLPPSLIQPLDGPVLEEIALTRDEVANMAWAIERRLESPLEIGVETSRSYGDPAADSAAGSGGAGDLHEVPQYRLASTVTPHWIPMLPVRVDPDSPSVRLARGAVLDLAGSTRIVSAAARLLDVGDPAGRLLMPEEEVPREGLLVRRSYRAARWHDGELHVWTANRASVGKGEARSGLTFDTLD